MEQHHSGAPFMPDMRAFVPEKLRPWIVIALVMMVQLSGGVYLAAIAEMVGSTALLQEDVMMAGYASLAGMSLNFVLMFRLKFRFPTREIYLICAPVIIVANLVGLLTTNVFWITLACFIMGFFRMWATFCCNTQIQLWITPKRDMSVWFCYIYLIVQGMIQLTGIFTVYVATLAKWEYVHYTVIALMLLLILAAMTLFRHYRSMPKLPLYGIDWLGMLMWGGTLLCIIFVAVYGEHYDWWQSEHIRYATGCGLLLLALNLLRASFIRHPFIDLKIWTHRATWYPLLIYILVDILISPSHLFEHIYTETILGYDAEHVISLNWVALAGTICGAAFTWRTFALRKWTYRTMCIIAFMAITSYLVSFYFIIDYNLEKSALVFPIFCRSFGYVVWAIIALTMVTKLPFELFFQGICVQAFVSAATGAAIGAAVLHRVFNIVFKKNAMFLGATLDNVNLKATSLPFGQVYGALQQQALMVSMKEIFGWLSLVALLALLGLLFSKSDLRATKAVEPAVRTIRRLVKHNLRVRGLWKKQMI